jgi:G protein-coupled receptor Mth (Methuselah protein)
MERVYYYKMFCYRDLRPTSLDKGQETFRLRLYQLYAWGGPLLIAGIAGILDSLPEEIYSSLLRPRFGQQRCWFYGMYFASETVFLK